MRSKQYMLSALRTVLNTSSIVKDLVSLKFHFKKLRVIRAYHSQAPDSKHLVILVIYQKKTVPFYIRNIICTLRKFDIHICAVVNHDAPDDVKQFVIDHAHTTMVRKNQGRDFGAYKDAILSFDLKKFDKLSLINDSTFFFSKNLEETLSEFLYHTAPWVALYENHEKHYHAQSFMLSFDKTVIHQDGFLDFWKKYKPFDSRIHAIDRGEVALSKHCMQYCGCTAINSILSLKHALDNASFNVVFQLLHIFSIHHPGNIGQQLDLVIQTSQRLLGRNYFTKMVTNQDIAKKCYSICINKLLASINNPTHSVVAFLFPILFQRNIFKRDLIYRQMLQPHEFVAFLYFMQYDLAEIIECKDIIASSRQYGHFNRIEKLKYRLGLL